MTLSPCHPHVHVRNFNTLFSIFFTDGAVLRAGERVCFGPLIAGWCQASSPRFHRGQFLCHGRADPLHREGRVEVLRGKRGAFPDNGAVWCVLRIESFDRLVCPDAGVTVLSEVDERLMMMIGCDASSTAAKYGLAAFSRNTEVIPPPSRRGHRRLLVGEPTNSWHLLGLGGLGLAPLERGPVHPDAMQNDGELARDRNLRLLQTDALGQPHAPGLQPRPALRAMKQNAGGLVEVTPQQAIAPSRDLTFPIQFTH